MTAQPMKFVEFIPGQQTHPVTNPMISSPLAFYLAGEQVPVTLNSNPITSGREFSEPSVPTVSKTEPVRDFPGNVSLRNHAYVKTNTTLTHRNLIIEIRVTVSMSATRLSLLLEYDLIFSEDQEKYITPYIIRQLSQQYPLNSSWEQSYSSSRSQINGRFGGKYSYDDTYDVVTQDIQAGKFPKYLEMHYSKVLGIARIFTEFTKGPAKQFTDELVNIISK